jgi:hypothetical protein
MDTLKLEHCKEKPFIICEFCGKKRVKDWKGLTPPRFCSKSCSAQWRAGTQEGRNHHVRMGEASVRATGGLKERWKTAAFREVAVRRMKVSNPMHDDATRIKAGETKKGRPFPAARGGNGKPMPIPQLLLMELTGLLPEYSVGVPRDIRGRISRAPKCYKIDLASPQSMLAVEIDGQGHHALKVRKADQKKDGILSLLGWTVLRFSNKEVIDDPQAAAAKIRTFMT